MFKIETWNSKDTSTKNKKVKALETKLVYALIFWIYKIKHQFNTKISFDIENTTQHTNWNQSQAI